MTTKKLSEKQKNIMNFIVGFMEENQYPPTVRDIQHGCEISSTSVVDYNLRILQREGHLARQPDVSRGIVLGERHRRAISNTVAVPIMGNIAAGSPLPVAPSSGWREQGIDSVDLPAFLTDGREDVYAVRVRGESMIDALVADGDLVLLEPASDAGNGDMVAARLRDDEVTLKRFYLEGGSVRLQPANVTMDPIVVPADQVAVQGKVVGVIRTI